RKASMVTAGSSTGSSSRRRNVSSIDRLLERLHADAAIGIEKPLPLLALGKIEVGRLFDRIDNSVFVEAGAGDLGLRHVFGAGSAQKELIALRAFSIDTQDADMASVVMAAGIDATRNLDL